MALFSGQPIQSSPEGAASAVEQGEFNGIKLPITAEVTPAEPADKAEFPSMDSEFSATAEAAQSTPEVTEAAVTPVWGANEMSRPLETPVARMVAPEAGAPIEPLSYATENAGTAAPEEPINPIPEIELVSAAVPERAITSDLPPSGESALANAEIKPAEVLPPTMSEVPEPLNFAPRAEVMPAPEVPEPEIIPSAEPVGEVAEISSGETAAEEPEVNVDARVAKAQELGEAYENSLLEVTEAIDGEIKEANKTLLELLEAHRSELAENSEQRKQMIADFAAKKANIKASIDDFQTNRAEILDRLGVKQRGETVIEKPEIRKAA